MRDDYRQVLETLVQMEAEKLPMISPADIARRLGEDEQDVSDIL
jgi:DNA-directed RNA polymerase subunit H (RpoH/RPB5)